MGLKSENNAAPAVGIHGKERRDRTQEGGAKRWHKRG